MTLMHARIFLFLFFLSVYKAGVCQELLCTVDVNTINIEGTNKSVFESLKQTITDYLNETKWTNTVVGPEERIECKFFLTVTDYYNDRIKGDLQVQLSRPVYNTNYNTTLFNFKDTKVEFEYREGEPIVFNENIWTDNLTGILDFYAYLFLALDFDSFSRGGGDAYFDKAATVVQQAQSSGESGWRVFEDTRNRSAVLSAFTDANRKDMQDLLYAYHREGLDEMTTSVEKGRASITESLEKLEEVYRRSPMSVGLAIFRDSKLDELVNLYSKATKAERDRAYEILQPIYPTEIERLEKIKKGGER